MDFITGLPTTAQGHDAVLTFVDRLTKQAHFIPTKSTIDAAATADLYFQNVYRLHGLSRSIVSDRDPRFTAELYRTIFKVLGVRLDFSTANHPQTDGMTERVHRVIGQILRSVVNHRQTNWEEMLPLSEFAYNDMVQGSTGETPFFLNHGYHPLSFPEVAIREPDGHTTATHWLEQKQSALRVAKDSIQTAINRQTEYADQSRVDVTYKVGEKVMVSRDYMSTQVSRDQPCAKLKPRWFGPFEIIRVPSRSTVLLGLPSTCRAHPVFNVAAVKRYHEDRSLHDRPPPPSPIIDNDGHERFIVQEVLSDRRYYGRQQYLVKWQGYEEPTWEPAVHLQDESGHSIVPLQNYLAAKQ